MFPLIPLRKDTIMVSKIEGEELSQRYGELREQGFHVFRKREDTSLYILPKADGEVPQNSIPTELNILTEEDAPLVRNMVGRLFNKYLKNNGFKTLGRYLAHLPSPVFQINEILNFFEGIEYRIGWQIDIMTK